MTQVTNCKREECMAYLLKNYEEWPPKYALGHHASVSHYGYCWHQNNPEAEWCLVNKDNDIISKAEFHVAYFEDIRMEHHFDEEFITTIAKMLKQSEGNERGYEVTLSRAQVRAMCHALSQHDKTKDKLARINEAAYELNKVLTQ